MDNGKYIVVEYMDGETVIVFSNIIPHNDIARGFEGKVVSAGFFEVASQPTDKDELDISVCVFGKSTTLKLQARDIDSSLIKKILRKTYI